MHKLRILGQKEKNKTRSHFIVLLVTVLSLYNIQLFQISSVEHVHLIRVFWQLSCMATTQGKAAKLEEEEEEEED